MFRARVRLRVRLLELLGLGEAPANALHVLLARRGGDHLEVVFLELVTLEKWGLVRSRAWLDAPSKLDRLRRVFALTDAGARELATRREEDACFR